MGAGFHGGFGENYGSQERYRFGKPVVFTERSYEMALNPEYYSSVIAKKYNIHLKGSKKQIVIKFNPALKSSGRVVKSKPNVIELGPLAFVSETELANTIAHELNHARSFIKGGNAPEPAAYRSGNKLEEYMKGLR